MTIAGSPGSKICIVTPEFPPYQWGGLARTALKASGHARDMGLEVHVAHMTVADGEVVLLDENRVTSTFDGITLHKLSLGRETIPDGKRELWDCPHNLTLQMMFQSIELLHEEERFDLFHSFFLYPVGYVTGLLARRSGRPSVVSIVGNDVKRYLFSPEKVAVCKSGLDNADLVVGLSEDLIDLADALTPIKQKARVIYNSVDIPTESWTPARNEDAPYRIGCAGIFKYAKGLPYLFKAILELSAHHETALELRGHLRPAEKAVFRTMIERTGIRWLVRLDSPLPHERMSGWLQSLDIFVLPSVSEGCPNVLMEALAAGVPCVATRTGAAERLIEDGKTGLLVPWGNSKALCESIRRLIEDPAGAAEMGAAAGTAMAGFSAERERSEWEGVYRGLLGL
ncbi:MAG: glycosyltransferase [Pseudomonadota bacterium]